MVRDAVQHSRAPERMALADAFDAATRGAHWAAFADRAGLIAAGWQADLAIWDVDPDQLDPASGLPRLAAGAPLPECAATIAAGRIVHERRNSSVWVEYGSARASATADQERSAGAEWWSSWRPGSALGLSWQPYGFWPLLLVGIPALTLAVRDLPLRRSFGLGYLFGLAMLTVSISWLHVLGVWVAALLILFEALFFGLLGARPEPGQRAALWPLAAACCWVAVEFAYSRVPFGGFGWTRIAYAAVDTPLAGFLPIIGVAGLSFVVALIGQLVAGGASSRCAPSRERRGRVLVAALVAVGSWCSRGGGLRFYQAEPAETAASVQVGIVQGNIPGRGIEALGRARSVTNNHLSETIDLMTRVRLGELPQPDFLLWPENSTDIDPRLDATTRATVQAATEVADRPILVGAVLEGPGAGRTPDGGLVVGSAYAACWPATPSATWCRSVNGSRSAGSCCRWSRS